MKNYVVGFMFNNRGCVALIRKNRPEWQAGMLNGVGGHIEPYETAIQAMRREFNEEAGVDVEWEYFCHIYGEEYNLYCFRSTQDCIIQTLTDEAVDWHPLKPLPFDVIPNLNWLIPMANYKQRIMASVNHADTESVSAALTLEV